MTDQAPEATIVCVCGSRAFYAMPDGANSYLLECPSCGRRSEISAGRGMALTLTELPDRDDEDAVTT